MVLSKEERIEYNRNYYSKNKNVILQKASAKTECPFCKSLVAKCYMDTHKMSSICKRREEKRRFFEQRVKDI